MRNHQETIKHVDRFIELAGESEPDLTYCWLYLRRAEAYRNLGKVDEAIADLEKAEEVNLGDVHFYINLAMAYRGLGEADKALAAYDRAEELTPNNVYIYENRGEVYNDQARYQEALADYDKALELTPRRSWTYKRRGEAHFNLGHYHEALADIAKAVELNLEDLSALTWIGSANLANCPDEEFKKGILALADKTIELTNGSINAYSASASLYASFGRLDRARADSEKAIKLGIVSYYTWYMYACVCIDAGDRPAYRKACADMLQQFAESSKTSELYLAAWSCVLAPDAVDDYSPAIESAEQAVVNDANSEDYLKTLGGILYRAGRFEEAVQRLTEANNLIEDSDAESQVSPAYTWYFLAMAHHKLGNGEEAEKWLQKANESTDKVLVEHEEGTTPLSWNRRLTLKLLREEAEALLGSWEKPKTDADDKSQELEEERH